MWRRGGTLWPDVRHAGRSLAKSPGFAAAAVVTLALGIGASTALFRVLENVLMEPFPYADAHRLMSVMIHDSEQQQPGGRAFEPAAPPVFVLRYEVWIPHKPAAALDPEPNGFPRYWYLLGHLKPGIGVREAEADLDAVARRLAQVYPRDYPKRFSVQVQALAEQVVGQFRSTLLIVLGAASSPTPVRASASCS